MTEVSYSTHKLGIIDLGKLIALESGAGVFDCLLANQFDNAAG